MRLRLQAEDRSVPLASKDVTLRPGDLLVRGSPKWLRAGVRVRLVGNAAADPSIRAVPVRSVRAIGAEGKGKLLSVRADGVVVRRAVQFGNRVGDLRPILSGLQPGDAVVISKRPREEERVATDVRPVSAALGFVPAGEER